MNVLAQIHIMKGILSVYLFKICDLLQLGLLHHHHLIHQVCGSGRCARVQNARVTVWIRVAVMFLVRLYQNPLQPLGAWVKDLGDFVVQGWRRRASFGQELLLGRGSFSNTRFSSYDMNLPVEYLVEVKQ